MQSLISIAPLKRKIWFLTLGIFFLFENFSVSRTKTPPRWIYRRKTPPTCFSTHVFFYRRKTPPTCFLTDVNLHRRKNVCRVYYTTHACTIIIVSEKNGLFFMHVQNIAPIFEGVLILWRHIDVIWRWLVLFGTNGKRRYKVGCKYKGIGH